MDDLHAATLALVKMALKEDIGPGDLTSLAGLEPNAAQGDIVAKSDGVLSGVRPAMIVFDSIDSANRLDFKFSDGDSFSAGDTIAVIDGFNQTVLASERVALNFLGRLSGIATMTRAFVNQIGDRPTKILDTRKTTPGWRRLEKEAVRHGGGMNHRIGLYDMVLIKDNHIASAGSITAAVDLVREFLETPDFRLQFSARAENILIEVEVTSPEELSEAITCKVDRLLLDNQSIDSLTKLVRMAREKNPDIKLEASGNVNLETVAGIAATGVDFISVGAITHSAPSADFSLRLTE